MLDDVVCTVDDNRALSYYVGHSLEFMLSWRLCWTLSSSLSMMNLCTSF